MDSQIPPLPLPSGATVEFVDLDDLTGADVHALRRTIAVADSGGEIHHRGQRTHQAVVWNGLVQSAVWNADAEMVSAARGTWQRNRADVRAN